MPNTQHTYGLKTKDNQLKNTENQFKKMEYLNIIECHLHFLRHNLKINLI